MNGRTQLAAARPTMVAGEQAGAVVRMDNTNYTEGSRGGRHLGTGRSTAAQRRREQWLRQSDA